MPTAETEHYLKKVRTVTNKREGGTLTQKATRYLKTAERQQREDEIKGIDDVLGQPSWVLQSTGATRERLAGLLRRKEAIKQELQEDLPPTDISGETKDALHARQKELEDKIRVGMLTAEEMRRNPVGAVDRHRKWDKANTPRILEWKNIKRLLSPDSDEADLANIEQLRPTMLPARGATFMADAQIPGKFDYASVPTENWEQTFGAGSTVNPNSPYARADSEVELATHSPDSKTAKATDYNVDSGDLKESHEDQVRRNRREGMQKAREKRWANKEAKE